MDYEYERKWVSYNKKFVDVTVAQLRCLHLASDWLHGLHHAPDTVRPFCDDAIELVFHRGKTFATFDFDELTRLVFLAHDQCIRAEIASAGMHLAVRLFARHTREGSTSSRHPTLPEVAMRWTERQGTVFP